MVILLIGIQSTDFYCVSFEAEVDCLGRVLLFWELMSQTLMDPRLLPTIIDFSLVVKVSEVRADGLLLVWVLRTARGFILSRL